MENSDKYLFLEQLNKLLNPESGVLPARRLPDLLHHLHKLFGKKHMVEVILILHIPYSRQQMMEDILWQEEQILLEQDMMMFT